jgi:hypothetical protein
MRSGAMGMFSSRPHGVLRGSFGRYVGRPSLDALVQSAAYSGSASPRLRCLGAATPSPDWAGLLSGSLAPPGSCSDAGSLVDSGSVAYQVARPLAGADAWRATLGWASAIHGFSLAVEGTWSTTRRILSLALDETKVSRFTSLPDGRTVFVFPEAIDPTSGLLVSGLGAGASRPRYLYDERGSGRASQLTLSLTPLVANVTGHHWSAAYTIASSTISAYGLDHPGAAGAPQGERAPARFDIRHSIVGQAGIVTRAGYSLVLLARAQSGLPFTPIIAGDVDGDGVSGDRAYFPGNTAPENDSLLVATQRLAATTTRAGRACIHDVQGTIAGINSCRTPWSFNATLFARSPAGLHPRLHLSERVTATAYADNVVSLVDRIVHGDHSVGWGSSADLDPVAFRVSGFDAANRRFIYRPNPAFGRARASASSYRVGFTVAIDLSQPPNAQSLQRFLSPGRGFNPGPRLSADTIAQQFGRTVVDVYDMVLVQSDSLLLRQNQIDSLLAWQPEYRRTLAAMWGALGHDLAGLDDGYDAKAALARTDSVTDEAWAVAQQHARRIFVLLDPLQQALLPQLLQTLGTSAQRVRIRVTTPW